MSFLSWVLLCWVVLYAVVRFLDRRSHSKLSVYLNQRNVAIYPLGFTVSTARFNSHLENIAKRHRAWLSYWFALGVGFGLFGLVASVVVLAGHMLAVFNVSHVTRTPELGALWRAGASARSYRDPKPSTRVLLEKPAAMRKLIDWGTDGKRSLKKVRQWRRDRRERIRSKHRGYHKRAQSEQQAAQVVDPQLGDESHDHLDSVQSGGAAKDNVKLVTAARFPVAHREHPVDATHLDIQQAAKTIQSKTSSNAAAAKPPLSRDTHIDTDNVTGGVRTTSDLHVSDHSTPSAILTPLLPGVTVPAFHAVYLAIAILVAAAVHELGHALAAASYDAQVARVGGFFAVVFPGAFVQLEGVDKLSYFAQLKVWCAGAWHNFVTALAALGLLAILPAILNLLFAMRAGALVVNVPLGSPMEGALFPGDIISHFGPIPVVDGGKAFRRSVHELVASNYTSGFCVTPAVFGRYASEAENCCFATRSDSLICFHPIDVARRKTCLPGHVVPRLNVCRKATDCALRPDGGRANCLIAQFPDTSRLIDIHVNSITQGRDHRLVYMGDPAQLARAATVSSYVPRIWAVLPESVLRLWARADIPNHLQRLLQYFASISLAIALLNLAPVYRLDGEQTAVLFIKMVAPDMSPQRVKRFKKVLIRSCTALLIVNLAVASQRFGMR